MYIFDGATKMNIYNESLVFQGVQAEEPELVFLVTMGAKKDTLNFVCKNCSQRKMKETFSLMHYFLFFRCPKYKDQNAKATLAYRALRSKCIRLRGNQSSHI